MDQQEKPPPLQKSSARRAIRAARASATNRNRQSKIANPQAAVTERRLSAESQRVMSMSFGQAWLQLKMV